MQLLPCCRTPAGAPRAQTNCARPTPRPARGGGGVIVRAFVCCFVRSRCVHPEFVWADLREENQINPTPDSPRPRGLPSPRSPACHVAAGSPGNGYNPLPAQLRSTPLVEPYPYCHTVEHFIFSCLVTVPEYGLQVALGLVYGACLGCVLQNLGKPDPLGRALGPGVVGKGPKVFTKTNPQPFWHKLFLLSAL